MKPRRDHPLQATFSFAATVLPRGDGSYIVSAGKPQAWLWVRDAARASGLSADAIRDMIHAGTLTARRVGRRKFQVLAESLEPHMQADNWRDEPGTAEPAE